MWKWLLMGALVLLQIGVAGPACALFGASQFATGLNFCSVFNCEGTALFSPCDGPVVLQDCLVSEGAFDPLDTTISGN
jgi:hypothetical protein